MPDGGKAGLVSLAIRTTGSFCPLRFRGVKLAGRWTGIAQIYCSSCNHVAAILVSDTSASRFNFLVLCIAPVWSPWFIGRTGRCRFHKLQTGTADVCHRPLRRIWSCWPEIRQRLHFLGFVLETSPPASHLNTNIFLSSRRPCSEFMAFMALRFEHQDSEHLMSYTSLQQCSCLVQEQERMGTCQLDEMPLI